MPQLPTRRDRPPRFARPDFCVFGFSAFLRFEPIKAPTASGRLNSAIRDQENEAHFTYDRANRLHSTTQPFEPSGLAPSITFDYEVDSNGARRIAHYPGGRDVTHALDGRGRLASVSSGSDVGVTWTHDLADRRTAAARPNAINTLFGYDTNDRLTSLNHQLYTGGIDPSVIDQRIYGYDPVGNRTYSRIVLPSNRSELYTHDNRNRLWLMQRGELNEPGDAITTPLVDSRPSAEDWTLDARGNWSEANTIASGQSDFKFEAQPNEVNEYTQITRHWGQFINTTQPAYDPAGNLTFDPTAPNVIVSGSGQLYEYDEENRLKVARDGSTSALLEISYDALGRRVESRDHTAAVQCGFGPPVVTRHVMAGLHTLEEHIQCASSGSNAWTLAREFIWGDRFPEPVAMVTHGGTSGGFGGSAVPSGTTVYYYLHDALGSVVGLANAAGQLIERYTYDPYGKTRIFSGSGTTTIACSAYGNPFAWTGQRFDAAMGIYHFLCRSYSLSLGRWLQRDPAGNVSGPSLYEYIRSAPCSAIDPLGLHSTDDHNLIIDDIDVPVDVRQIFKDASERVDSVVRGGQSQENAYQHSMRTPWESRHQARVKRNNWIFENEQAALKLISNGGSVDDALFLLGLSLHALADESSSEHGFDIWWGLANPLAWPIALWHHLVEGMSPSEKAAAVAALRQYLDNVRVEICKQQGLEKCPSLTSLIQMLRWREAWCKRNKLEPCPTLGQILKNKLKPPEKPAGPCNNPYMPGVPMGM